jgi:hypothetical protein
MSKINWRSYDDTEDDAAIESQKPRTKSKKSWKNVSMELNKKGYEKHWKNKRRNGKKTHHKST